MLVVALTRAACDTCTGVQAHAEPAVAAARRAALDSLPVDDAAVAFGRDLTAALDEAEAHAVTFTPLKVESFSADRYVKVRVVSCGFPSSGKKQTRVPTVRCGSLSDATDRSGMSQAMCRQRPVLFGPHGQRTHGSLTLHRLVHDDSHSHVKVSVKWPQNNVPHGVSSMRELRPYFEAELAQSSKSRYMNPPNVVDSELAAFGSEVEREYRLPPIVSATNLLCSLDEQEAEKNALRAAVEQQAEGEREDGGTRDDEATLRFRADLVLSPAEAVTRFHVDSGFATWFDMLEGSKDWAMCSFEDGVALGLHERRPLQLEELLKKPSAAVCRLRAGQSLFFPAGYFHFVVTRSPSFGFSNNLITLGGYGVATNLYQRDDADWAFDVERRQLLQRTHRRALEAHVVRTGAAPPLRSRGAAAAAAAAAAKDVAVAAFATEGVTERTTVTYRNLTEVLWASM
jgi:hypothetical protein